MRKVGDYTKILMDWELMFTGDLQVISSLFKTDNKIQRELWKKKHLLLQQIVVDLLENPAKIK